MSFVFCYLNTLLFLYLKELYILKRIREASWLQISEKYQFIHFDDRSAHVNSTIYNRISSKSSQEKYCNM